MNLRETKCAKILNDMTDNDGLIGIKTSFEDEGATFNEVIRLKQVCNEAKTKITLKIGGPEAIRDLKDSVIIGVKGIVAPMVETPFALQKFIGATKAYIDTDVLDTLQLNVNIETITAVQNINSIIATTHSSDLYGITVGRVDLVSSMGKDRGYVNSKEVYEHTRKVFIAAKAKGLKACLGGAISMDSLEFLKKLHSDGLLDKFETRYAIFDPATALKNLSKALSKAQMFEYEWLLSKNESYNKLANQDIQRIKMIQDRLNQSLL
jgi:4-hydroxy-2-oxoheptanedioate aldolase